MAKELEIGKWYNLDNTIYAVVEATGYDRCDGCAFYNEEEGECEDAFLNKMGGCTGGGRSDGKTVIFVNMGEGNDPHPDGEVHEVTPPND